MRNRIVCSAKKLSQLEPNMVHSVVGGHVFKLGKQYLSESRVRIIDSSESQINSEVAGTYGVYAQNIRLKSGNLTTKCSCPATEQPFCRHCVAVLLEFYNSQISQTPVEEPAEVPQEITAMEAVAEVSPSPSPSPSPSDGSSVDLKFHEVGIFIDWVQATVQALSHGNSLPPLPELGPGQVRNWAEAIQDLRDQCQRSDGSRRKIEIELQDCQKRIVSLTQDLEGMTQEAKEAKVANTALQRELDDSREMLDNYAEVAKERDRYVDQLNSMRGELLRKGAELDGLVANLKQFSAGLQEVTPPPR
jgi:regulator of replication initiation timing